MNTSKFLTLNINPEAKYEWERIEMQCPLTREEPSLKQLLADTIEKPGRYLISIEVKVAIVEQMPLEQEEPGIVVRLEERVINTAA
jgi:hypothetical protein